MSSTEQQQFALPGLAQARAAARSAKAPQPSDQTWAAEFPVAQVLVDLPLAHLDRPFDYRVPAALDAAAQPGVRVKVRFAGRQVDGYLIARSAASEHTRLQPLLKVVSPELVLGPDIVELTGAIARRYAGTRSDVLRLAVPARHARTEKEPIKTSAQDSTPAFTWIADPADWSHYAGFEQPGSAVLSVTPGDDWTAVLCAAVAPVAAAGKGVVVCVPDRRDVDRLDAAMRQRWGDQHHVVLTADVGPAARYRAFLQVARGERRIAIGTRAAAFAPVRHLGLVVMWDDGDDLFYEPRAPYCHTREVLLLRAQQSGCRALLAAHARSVEAQYLVTTGWAREIVADREFIRSRVRVGVTGDSAHDLARDPAAQTARLPSEALQLIRSALKAGPVLVQTPRSGYATRLACQRCREPAQCDVCRGPLRIPAPHEPPHCSWCGVSAGGWACPECGGRGLRAPIVGHARTAEELGRSFPGVRIRTSSGERILSTVSDMSIVVATVGAEPVARSEESPAQSQAAGPAGGYAGVVILDTWLTLARSDLRAVEEAARRWANAIALVAPGAPALLVGEGAHPAVQALIRWDLPGLALREMQQRRQAHLPPASRMASLEGDLDQLEAGLSALQLPTGTEVLGPVSLNGSGSAESPTSRYVLRAPRANGAALSDALRDLQARRSVRKQPHLRVQVDPHDLG